MMVPAPSAFRCSFQNGSLSGNKTEPRLKHRDNLLPTLDVLPFPTRLKNLHTLPSHTLLIFLTSISKS